MRVSPPRANVWARVQERLQEEEQDPARHMVMRPDCKGVWSRLVDPTLHRPHRITCWRLLHGCLGCGAFLAHVRRSGSAFCMAPCCGAGDQLDTLTHAFLRCPDSQPVVAWMVGVWRSLAGEEAAVPETPEFILADDPMGWAGAADPALHQMWTRLRVATLGSLWHVRTSRLNALPGASFANTVVRLAVRTLRAAIERDWSRTLEDVRQVQGASFCTDWWRGCDAGLSRKRFIALWAQPPVFCRVEEPVGGVEILISCSSPVPVPA